MTSHTSFGICLLGKHTILAPNNPPGYLLIPSLCGGNMTPYQMVHAATAVTTPVKAKKAPFDWSARSSGVGILRIKNGKFG
jgi:hypothetical protein